MKKIQSWDSVIVTAWKWKWTKSTIIKVIQKKDKRKWDWVTVKWVNVVKKSKKWEWFIEFEAPIHSSNVLVRDDSSNSWSRVGFREWKKWKERFFKKSWKSL